MMSDSYIPLAEREAWSDIKPIPQNDGPNPLVPIMYSQEYKDAMDYFRALSAAEEYSERGLELTETIIRMNPAHYTIWQFRWATLLALNKDLEAELELMNEFAHENLKSYQVWHHRLQLMTAISPSSPRKEIDYIHDSLLPDPKNYHTWAYLHWLYSHFSNPEAMAAGGSRISADDWEAEQRWCDEMLRVDGRNNSAWSWRWFLRVSRPQASGLADGGIEEIKYVLKAIHTIPHNVSAWNYLRGLLKHLRLPFSPLLPAILPYCAGSSMPLAEADPTASTPTEQSILPMPADPLPNDTPLPISHALEFAADALAEQGRLGEASQVFAELASTHDRMRAGYWEFRRRECAE